MLLHRRRARRSGPSSAGGSAPLWLWRRSRADESYAIAIDPGGKLRWESGSIDEEHAVTVLTEQVPDRYLALLRSRGVSYLFGGK